MGDVRGVPRRLDRTPRAIDVGTLVPHGPVRTYVMGERGVGDAAGPEDIAAIVGIIKDALGAGALGCSTNRTLRKGAVVPGSFAAEEELLAIARVVGARGGILQTSPASFFGLRIESALRKRDRTIRR